MPGIIDGVRKVFASRVTELEVGVWHIKETCKPRKALGAQPVSSVPGTKGSIQAPQVRGTRWVLGGGDFNTDWGRWRVPGTCFKPHTVSKEPILSIAGVPGIKYTDNRITQKQQPSL